MSNESSNELTHTDEPGGEARMVDVGDKASSDREATARLKRNIEWPSLDGNAISWRYCANPHNAQLRASVAQQERPHRAPEGRATPQCTVR